MADIVKRGQPQGQQNPSQPQLARSATREFSPWQRMREVLGWDPFQEMGWPTEPVAAFVPAFEVRETHDGYVFKADVPGVVEDDLDIHLTGNRLTIGGKREMEQRNENESGGDRYYAYEIAYGSFTRSFTLPDGVDAEGVKAELKNGVLTVHVPKRAEAQPKRIQLGATKPKA